MLQLLQIFHENIEGITVFIKLHQLNNLANTSGHVRAKKKT